ncbi:MAG TPA: glycosyltransferase family 1 protein [Candidatus Angelobacter sp.]|nr:glycosyltransferase family 1 protein [Candidatus Angelobacter sp.]
MAKGATPAIAFDSYILGAHARNHGIYVYAKKLLEYFREMAPRYSVEIVPYVSPRSDNGANQFTAAPGFRPRPTRLLERSRAWRWGGASLLTLAAGADLVFSPAGTTLYWGRWAPSVVTIHDLIPVMVSTGPKRANRLLRFFYWSGARLSQHVITDSHNSKADLVRLYKVPESKVSVVYLGCDHESFNCAPPDPELQSHLLKKLGITRPYIVHHGVIKGYKNLKRLIQAYRAVLERNRTLDFDLVLAGPLGWEYDEILAEAASCEGSRAKVVFTRALSDSDLATLVKGATLAVIPSLYEGFCLPMVESMACGTPTIAANSSCLPEVSGGALRYFDPLSVEAIAAALEEVLESATLRKELSEKGRVRAAEFDWRRCAEQTLQVLAQSARDVRENRGRSV